MTDAVAIRDDDRLTPVKVEEVKEQVALIQELMSSVMHDGEHYGVIPGTKKPSLYKSGAEKLGFTFRLSPDFTVTVSELPNAHRDYLIHCTLTSIKNGTVWGRGVGSCSTMESKYRYRHGEPEDTGVPVPGKYWEAKKADHPNAQELLGGKGFITKKNAAGQWRIFKVSSEKVENPDIADVYNTVLKMAKKRAHVDAILTALAASDIFTQDMEDKAEPEKAPEAEKTAKPESPVGPTGDKLPQPGPEGPGLPVGGLPLPPGDPTPTEKLLIRIQEHLDSGKLSKAALTKYLHTNFCDKAHKEPVCGDVRKLALLQLQAVSAWLTMV